MVPLPKLIERIDKQTIHLATGLSTAWSKYEFDCNLSNISTNELSPNFELISKPIDKQIQAAKNNIRELQGELIETMGSTISVSSYSSHRNKTEASLISFGALTALSARADIACQYGQNLEVAEALTMPSKNWKKKTSLDGIQLKIKRKIFS